MTAESPATTATDAQPTEVPPMLAVYRHDIHKLRGRSHTAASETAAGVRVNETVPRGADGDAALLSRPRGDPEQTVPAHALPFRLSLLSGEIATDQRGVDAFRAPTRDLAQIDDPERAHRAWLDSKAAAAFNEAAHYPYTSLKYHVLLTAALLSNYRDGATFDALSLVVDDADTPVTPHRTVLQAGPVSLRVTADPDGRPAASLGAAPTRSFADVWARLPTSPIDVDADRRWRILDAQLRRLRSWSTALQFIEEYIAATDGGGR
ncbi:Uncharacterized protein HSRCO_1533 [Halanaeroarchaeum sp. HSR-CO]|uniref:hypothetical protein n=1 Tax=Halanaeroarchaeum sp. HSR-CO TaxID=2866382 RepID=UPI00217D8D3C|nr:hypothetical protein [Halanaeroarchaeum sp. HSR-CO]UWG47814.1 Uncharacterized protein HSRCO_1533 [Halanaeroarchaeum sp. HSR-CO]